jgi:SAM-dependent methyltransferase
VPARNTTQHDVWASGDAYEPFVGRWSRRVARDFVEWLALAGNSRWLDVGCGSGALTQTILATASPREVLGVDPSEGFIAHARRHTQDSRGKFQVGDAQALPVANSDFDVAVAFAPPLEWNFRRGYRTGPVRRQPIPLQV